MDSTNVAAGLSVEVDRLRARVAELEPLAEMARRLARLNVVSGRYDGEGSVDGRLWLVRDIRSLTQCESRDDAIARFARLCKVDEAVVRLAYGLAAIDGAGVAKGGEPTLKSAPNAEDSARIDFLERHFVKTCWDSNRGYAVQANPMVGWGDSFRAALDDLREQVGEAT